MASILKNPVSPLINPRKKAKKKKNALDVRLSESTPFQITEAYKAMRTNLLFSLAPYTQKIVVFSSPLPSEGKSTTCSNLAITMAQTGARVLVIDADLRRPTLHRIFKKHNNKGLSGYLAGMFSFEDVIRDNVVMGLDLITSGVIPPNPSELLGSNKMATFISASCEIYDYVFIDTPPVNVVTDAIVLGSKASGMVLITHQGVSTYDEMDRAIDNVKKAGVDVLGLVVTHARQNYRRYGRYGKYGRYLGRYKYSYQYK